MKVKVEHHQSLLDIAVQYTGRASNAYLIALKNDMSVHDEPEIGSEIELFSEEMDKDILNYYKAKNLKPATGIFEISFEKLNEAGIGYWMIGEFKVS